jgi:hypothetical protein
MRTNLTVIRRTGRTLIFPEVDFQVVLPFGIGLKDKNYSFEAQKTKAGLSISASPKDNPAIVTRISPTYSVVDWINLPNQKRPVATRFWVVQSDLERLRARQLIEREHYLIPAARGMFLVCGFEDQSNHRKPNIIGAAVLDTLYHGNPKQGRALFATEVLGDEKWQDWPRNKIVSRLNIAWASRFAVDKKYHGCGIGTRLAVHLKTIAREFRSPAADFIEVITTEPRTSEMEDHEKGNFLVQAGYTRMEQPMKSSPLRLLNLKTGYLDGIPARKHYYYTDLRDGR